MEAILGLLILGAIIGMWFALVRKTGYETGTAVLMAIGMLIPLLNLGIIIYFISTTWPIQAELDSLRAKAGVGRGPWADQAPGLQTSMTIGSEDDGQALMSAALRLESRGD